jgi:hypothetical protein
MYRLISDKKQKTKMSLKYQGPTIEFLELQLQKQETQQIERPKTITTNPSKKLEKQETQKNKIQCNNPPEKRTRKHK